jgi:ATP-dependent helicase/nuclease subunit A
MTASVADDERAREDATDPRRSVLLQAPAGSGKTTVLTQRLLRLLAEVDEPEEILAITFTRKAAAEMRARVLRALRGEIDVGTAQGQRLRALADKALAHAAARGWNLQEDPNRLRIQTIDSFNFRLASQLPVTARAGGSLVISERPEELFRHAARQTLISAEQDDGLREDAELLFERLDNRWSNVESLLAGMLNKRGHWLRYVLGQDPGALRARIAQSLESILRDHLLLACARISLALRREAGCLPQVGDLGHEPQCHEAWKRLAGLSLTEKDRWRKSITRALGTAFENATMRDALRACIERLSDVPGARELLSDLRGLPGAMLSERDGHAVEALSRLLRSAAAHLYAEFAAAGRVDHTYVAGAARAALTDAGLPTDLALQTGLSLRHILVDEFQDTSLAQFDLIETLTVGWEEGDGRTLFVVGDPMQSIYQFREAEVGLFFRARDEGIGEVRLEALRLLRNFRSEASLIAWTNDAFTELFPPVDDLRASAVAFTPSLAGSGVRDAQGAVAKGAGADIPAAAPVRLTLFPPGDRESEATAIAARITALRAADPGASVALLVASRTHAVPLMAAFEAARLDAIGVDIVPLSEVAVVRDLVALLRALHHLGDRTAWLAILRAPWCGASLASLTALSGRKDSTHLWDALSDSRRLSKCRPDDVGRLRRVRAVLDAALTNRDRGPLADWLEATWLQLGAADAYPENEFRHARAFFAALSERTASGEWRGPQDLDSLLSDLFAQPRAASANPVQIMTIHRAKGLEFDHVLIPAIDRSPGRDPEPLLRWLDLPRRHGGSDLIMAPVPAVGDQAGSEVGAYLKQLMAARATNERARLLYVAATRAKQTLWLSGAPKLKADGSVVPKAGTLLAVLWPTLGSQFVAAESVNGEVTAEADGRAATNSARPDVGNGHGAKCSAVPPPVGLLLRRLRADWAPPSLQTPAELERLPLNRQTLDPPEFSWVGETARLIGTVVHAGLEQFSRSASLPTRAEVERQRDDYAQQLRRHGVPEADLKRATETVINALSRTVEDQWGRWIFSPQHRETNSELALTGIAAGTLTNVIIDRSFIDSSGTRWVIDFKTSSHEGGALEAFLDREMVRYRSQLETYVALARALGPHPVRAALYFPLLGQFREYSAGQG